MFPYKYQLVEQQLRECLSIVRDIQFNHNTRRRQKKTCLNSSNICKTEIIFSLREYALTERHSTRFSIVQTSIYIHFVCNSFYTVPCLNTALQRIIEWMRYLNKQLFIQNNRFVNGITDPVRAFSINHSRTDQANGDEAWI